MTAAERLLALAGTTGTAAALLLAIGTGATTGAALLNYSRLASGPASAHLLAGVDADVLSVASYRQIAKRILAGQAPVNAMYLRTGLRRRFRGHA